MNLEILAKRFKSNMHRHEGIDFDLFYNRLNHEHIKKIEQMEDTQGEPDLVVIQGIWYVIDMYKESPEARVNVCYDAKARLSRKKFPPKTSALEMIETMQTTLIDFNLYQALQRIEPLDLKTSSWLWTPHEVRTLGGAYFGDNRYKQTFLYHNGADSYYGVRGFRGYFKI